MTGKNLLVVDWDFFFPNPMQAGERSNMDSWILYDWSHAESPFMVDKIWYLRAMGFLRKQMPLPLAVGYESFWDRFTLADGAPLAVADSNLYAGMLTPGDGGEHWSSVWLFDAHHDSGYRGTLDEWRASDRMSCEDWMLNHAEHGSELHVRYPQWRANAMTLEPQPLVPVDRQVDDGAPVPLEFHTVFVCRSGAWVPPWCDRQLRDFLTACPLSWAVNVDRRYPNLMRQFDEGRVRSLMADEDALHAFRLKGDG